MKYRIGWPFWKLAYKLGFTLTYKVEFTRVKADPEFQNAANDIYRYCGRFVGTNWILECGSYEELEIEAKNVAETMVEIETQRKDVKINGILSNDLSTHSLGV